LPLDHELLGENFLVADHHFHECACELAHLGRVFLSEVKNETLKQVLDTYFAILLDKL
jgi:hypothetical protein